MSAVPSTSSTPSASAVLRGLTAGAFAAAVSKTTVAPLDRLKLVLQLQTGTVTTARTSVGGASSMPYKGTVDCFRRLCAEQGVKSMWRGNCATVARCFPAHALNFVLRDYFRLLFLRDVDVNTSYGRFVLGNIAAGGCGGATSLLAVYPLDVARTRLAVNLRADGASQYRGIFHCLSEIGRREGLVGVYRGFVMSVQFVAVSRSVFFGFFDTIRGTVADDPRKLHFVSTWLIAQTCVVASSFICYPMDTIRRKLMMQSGETQKLYAGSVDCMAQTFQSGGYRAFYRGAVSNSLKSTSGALMVALYYEALKHI